MPRRRTTRTEDRARRINDERENNRTAIEAEAEREATAAAPAASGDASEDALLPSDAPF
jgi:hypothetical protein